MKVIKKYNEFKKFVKFQFKEPYIYDKKLRDYINMKSNKTTFMHPIIYKQQSVEDEFLLFSQQMNDLNDYYHQNLNENDNHSQNNKYLNVEIGINSSSFQNINNEVNPIG